MIGKHKASTHKLIDQDGKTVYTGTFEGCCDHYLSDECEIVKLTQQEAGEANDWILP